MGYKILYFYNSVNRISEEFYTNDNDEKHGEYKSYYRNGELRQICNYVNGMLHGSFKAYHDNGVLYEECSFVDSILEGDYKEFWYNGGIKHHFKFKYACGISYGIRHGEFITTSEDGNHVTTINYANDLLHGLLVIKSRDTILKLECYDKGVQIDLSALGIKSYNVSDDDMNMLRILYG